MQLFIFEYSEGDLDNLKVQRHIKVEKGMI